MSNAPGWIERAACRLADARLFDPLTRADGWCGRAGGLPLTAVARVAEAKAICARCPVTDECLKDGIRSGASGIHAGVMLECGVPTDGQSAAERQDASLNAQLERERRVVTANAYYGRALNDGLPLAAAHATAAA